MLQDSIFSRVVRNENEYTQLLCNLIGRHDEFRVAILTRFFSNQIARKIEARMLETQKTLPIRGGASDGRPDIFIDATDLLAIVEVKTTLHRSKTDNQHWVPNGDQEFGGYLGYLESHQAAERWFVFLIPAGWVHEVELRKFIRDSTSESGTKLKAVTWQEIYSDIDKEMLRDPLIAEFHSLLSERFEPITFNNSEAALLESSELLDAVWKLAKLINLVSLMAKSAGYKVKWESDLKSGGHGFYVCEQDELLYFGCWVAFTSQGRPPLCIAVKNSWGDRLRECFIANNPLGTTGYFDPTPWTLSSIPTELMLVDDAPSAIWQILEPIIKRLSACGARF